ncbi:hypothetical protein FHR32_001223 [Streptosporangium album]|uniref:Uncharacterized protein n=1 Tax=Streptosporangium album TaxID=47479 RepID=A0A7W7RRP2_9ACTN|nr:hypothetical protein [Streptosporangium album]MBB4936918.1 hypothetical protein [Streptosporangium album]
MVRKLMCAVALLVIAFLGIVVMEMSAQASNKKTPVGRDQYQVLLNQCRYADSARLRSECRAVVRDTYRVDGENSALDCRTYSGVTVCGELTLSKREAACVQHSVEEGLTRRRSEVECYAFY